MLNNGSELQRNYTVRVLYLCSRCSLLNFSMGWNIDLCWTVFNQRKKLNCVYKSYNSRFLSHGWLLDEWIVTICPWIKNPMLTCHFLLIFIQTRGERSSNLCIAMTYIKKKQILYTRFFFLRISLLHPKISIPCTLFDWYGTVVLAELKPLKFGQCIFCYFDFVSSWKRARSFIWMKLNSKDL